jgi:septal ring factor EnvC (AmiA/AmiB activator)
MVAIVILVVAWGTNPAGAVSGQYQRALTAYDQATAGVKAAQAKQAQAQTAYDQADSRYQQTRGQIQDLSRKIDSLSQQLRANEEQNKQLGFFSFFAKWRLTNEYHRLWKEWIRASNAQLDLQATPHDQEQRRTDAKSALDKAKQKQAAALLALNQAKNQRQRLVVQSDKYGAGVGDFSDMLMQIQQRWGRTHIPGSSVTVTSPTGGTN